MTFNAIIEARMNSSRLPGKILKKINGISFIELLIKRLSLTKSIDNIYVATTNNKKDDQLIKVLKKNKIKYYRGSEYNCLERVVKTCEKFKLKNIVMTTGDCPFIDFNLVEQCIQTYKTNNVDIVGNAIVRSFPDGMDTQVLSYKILKDSFKKAFHKEHFEHSTLFIRNNPNMYKSLNIFAPPNYFWPDLGLTLDEEKDLIFLKEIYKNVNKSSKDFTCLDVINFLKKNKNLIKINKNVTRKKVTITI